VELIGKNKKGTDKSKYLQISHRFHLISLDVFCAFLTLLMFSSICCRLDQDVWELPSRPDTLHLRQHGRETGGVSYDEICLCGNVLLHPLVEYYR